MPTPRHVVRAAGADDAAFLAAMLAVAADWRPGSTPRAPGEVLRDPTLARYVTGWPRPGDAGVVAEEAGRPVGAAWWRCFDPDDPDDPGFGFVDAAVPEVAIGVLADARGRGVGRALLDALVDRARVERGAGLSLSVEEDNPAIRIYRRCGFTTVSATGGAVTMVLRLAGPD